MGNGVKALVLGAAGLLAVSLFMPNDGDVSAMSASGAGGGGSDGVSIVSTGQPVLPISGPYVVTSNFGMRWGAMHAGLDLSSATAAPIMAAMGGTVTFAGPAGNAGNMVQIDHGNGVTTKSMHLSRIDVKAGEAVWPGKQIGLQGTTGDSTGPHLHFQIEVNGAPTDPRPFMAKQGVTIPPEGASGTGPAPATSPPRSDVKMDPGALAGAKLKEGSVPPQYEPWVVKASGTCKTVPAALIASQIEAESGWNPNAASPAGAMGLAQFMPATWAAYGRDDDGNGRVSPSDGGDAIMALARYDCAVADLVSNVPGDPVSLMLAGYNSGPGAVLMYKAIPPYAETQNYVAKIKAGAAKYSA